MITPEITKEEIINGYSDKYTVTVFNNSINTFDEVINILIEATGCSEQEAMIETWEVHNLGKSVVHVASEEKCNAVASVISRIGIRTEVSEV